MRRRFIAGIIFSYFAIVPSFIAAEIRELPSVQQLPGSGNNFFHPSPAAVPGSWLMTFQRILGSDCYGGTEVSFSTDAGRTWSKPVPVAPLAHTPLNDDLVMGVADVRSAVSADGAKVLLIGCDTVYSPRGAWYIDRKAVKPKSHPHGAYYTVFDVGSRSFGIRRMLRNPLLPPEKLWRVACAQIDSTADGDWILPAYFQHHGQFWAVETVRVHLNGDELSPVAWGNVLTLERGRGLLEPSLVRRGGFWYMTIRAEDGCAYVTVSADGLNWRDVRPWRWDDGTVLATGSTQQHWMILNNKLHLVYTRKTAENEHFMRYRTPMFMAEVDESFPYPRLKKSTEIVLLERRRSGKKEGLLGNFHVCNLPDGTALVADAYCYGELDGSGRINFTDLSLKQVRN